MGDNFKFDWNELNDKLEMENINIEESMPEHVL